MIRLQQEPLSNHTTFRIGGPALHYLIPETMEEVSEALDFARSNHYPFYVIGKGSNMLFSDEGYPGVLIEIGKGLAGITLSAMASRLAKESLSGFAFASGIPGTLGGGITMNAGAYGGEIKDCIQSARVLTAEGATQELSRDELELGYRTSIIQKESYIVLDAVFQFERGDKEAIQKEMRDLNQRRREKQPLEFPSAGSTFKRPQGYFAGKLIEDAGLRGYRVGGAQVSEKHCGFVINCGQATADDVKQVIHDVQQKVNEQFGVVLEPEVRIIK